jgi:hypothetical protein
MKTASGLYYGTISFEVGELIQQFFRVLPSFVCAAVRCVDSTRSPLEVLSVLRRYGLDARHEAATVLISADEIHHAATVGVFVGFDEVWLLDSDHPKTDLSFRSHLGSDFDGTFVVPLAVETDLRDAGCVLALQTDSSLNYATWDSAFAAQMSRRKEGHR